MKPDYSEWLTPDRLAEEERLWGEVEAYKVYAGLVDEALSLAELDPSHQPSVREIGCGTGWVPTAISREVQYVGIDKNPRCLALARAKNPGTHFVQADVRDIDYATPADLVCSFAVLKHFGLHEWDALVTKILSFGRHAAFTLPVTDADSYDDGEEFPHVWINWHHLHRVLEQAGHRVVRSGPLAGTSEEWYITAHV